MRQTFVLVHGGFHGGWAWRRVASRLRALGHMVYPLTLTGAGERAHLMGPEVDFECYVRDVIGVMESEEIGEAVLAGHSYGGHVISAIADRMPERVRHLVYFDGVVPLPEFMNGVLAPQWRARLDRTVIINGTACFPPPDPSFFGVTEAADAKWVRRRLTPFKVDLISTPIVLSHKIGNDRPATYLRCTEPPYEAPHVAASADHMRRAGARLIDLPTGHDAMITMPDEATAILVSAAASQR